MVRRESCIAPAGASPVRVSAGALGSRVRSAGEIPTAKRIVESLGWEGARERAVTGSERRASLDRLSAERRTGWPSRSCHGEGNRQRLVFRKSAGHPRGTGDGTFSRDGAEHERPYPVRLVGRRATRIRGRPKSRGAGRESEGLIVPMKAVRSRWREGALLWLRRRRR